MTKSSTIVLCLAVSACGGDDDGGAADGAPPDAQPDAQTVYDYCDDAPDAYTPPAPSTFYNDMAPGFVVTYPAENPYSWDKAILGKILFWEEQMSSDDTVACGTCHRSSAGGSDPRAGTGATFPSAIGGIHGAMGIRACSIGEGGEVVYDADNAAAIQVTKRKPPTYLDAMFAADLFWDGRALTTFTDPDTGEVAIATGGGLESQVVGPPMSSVEMACAERTWPDLHAKLEAARPLAGARDIPPDMLYALCANPSYPELFEAAFGDPAITTRRIAFAIATHERTLISNQTPYDRFQNGDAAAMTDQQKTGMNLFAAKGRCQRCHVPPLFASGQFVNLGLINFDNPGGEDGTPPPHVDLGREELTGLIADRGKFRTPTARNVGLREAQGVLHNGIGDGASLEELMAAYNVPPRRDAHTDPRMDPAVEGNLLGLTGEEISAINAFMREALTDPRVAAEEFPFDRPRLGSEPGSATSGE